MCGVAGVAPICLGVAVAIFGDRKLNVKEGKLLRPLFPSEPWHRVSVKLQKWVIAVLLVGFGLALIVG
jgi:cadmium resistance protein CadD (predicted permease)